MARMTIVNRSKKRMSPACLKGIFLVGVPSMIFVVFQFSAYDYNNYNAMLGILPQSQLTRSAQSQSLEPFCRRTAVFPFRVGCPATCVGYRPGIVRDAEPTLYRMSIQWDFAHFNDAADGNDYHGKGPLSSQRAPAAFVENFIKANQTLAEQVLSTRTLSQQQIPQLHFRNQRKMHLNLVYFCCLYEEETNQIAYALQEWNTLRQKEKMSDMLATLNHVDCWHIRYNAATVVLTADEATQNQIQKVYDDLAAFIHSQVKLNVTNFVPRKFQMPFHITLGGFDLGDTPEQRAVYNRADPTTTTLRPKDDITPYLPHIRAAADLVAQQFYHGFSGESNNALVIYFPPEWTGKITPHNK